MNKSIGESRVRTEFNPSNNAVADQIKQKTAELINLVSTIEDGSDFHPETGRLKSIAMTEYEKAAMWAVKAANNKKP